MRALLITLTSAILITVPLFLITCELIPEGLETAVRGQVYDSVKQKMLEGVEVAVYAAYPTFMPSSEFVGSDTTDADGKFRIKFVTAGGASRYFLRIVYHSSIKVPDIEETVHAGGSEFLTFYARELNRVLVEIHIAENPVGPIRVESLYGAWPEIPQHTRDTVVSCAVMPMELNSLFFKVFDRTAGKWRVNGDVFRVGIGDTTFVKNIANPAAWPTAY